MCGATVGGGRGWGAEVQISVFLMGRISLNIQSILVVSKSKGPSETLRDIRTSTYQIC